MVKKLSIDIVGENMRRKAEHEVKVHFNPPRSLLHQMNIDYWLFAVNKFKF